MTLRHLRSAGALLIVLVFVSACASSQAPRSAGSQAQSPAGSVTGQTAKKQESTRVSEKAGHRETGIASWYGRPYHGRTTASGETYDMNAMTAAHRTLPFGTRVLVKNLENGKTVKLTINDRGPFIKGRIIDVSRKGARVLGFENQGLVRVQVTALGPNDG